MRKPWPRWVLRLFVRNVCAQGPVTVRRITYSKETMTLNNCFAKWTVNNIASPFKPTVALAHLSPHPRRKRAHDWLADRMPAVGDSRRIEDIDLVQQVAIRLLSGKAEVRDSETDAHLARTQRYVQTLAERLARHPHFTEIVTPAFIKLIVQSAPLHDIGKVGIPESILHKPGKLDEREWQVMRTHARLGAKALEAVARAIPYKIDFLETAREIAHWHHEKWDGSGYPDGLTGPAIPLSARLMALADVFDALMSRRVYKEPMPFSAVVGIIEAGRGKHFDPDVVDAFVAEKARFLAIASERAGPRGAGIQGRNRRSANLTLPRKSLP